MAALIFIALLVLLLANGAWPIALVLVLVTLLVLATNDWGAR